MKTPIRIKLLKNFQVDYKGHIVFNHGWENCLPGNYEWVETDNKANVITDSTNKIQKK